MNNFKLEFALLDLTTKILLLCAIYLAICGIILKMKFIPMKWKYFNVFIYSTASAYCICKHILKKHNLQIPMQSTKGIIICTESSQTNKNTKFYNWNKSWRTQNTCYRSVSIAYYKKGQNRMIKEITSMINGSCSIAGTLILLKKAKFVKEKTKKQKFNT